MDEANEWKADEALAGKLKVLLIYEDAETGLRAQRSLALVQEKGGQEESLRVRLWRRDLLRTEWLREQATLEAVAADVIIVSLHGGGEVPEEIRGWLSSWLGRKTDRPCALGVLLDLPSAAHQFSNATAAYLQAVAVDAGVDLLWGFYDAQRPEFDLGKARRRAGLKEFPTAAIPHESNKRVGNSHWGINE